MRNDDLFAAIHGPAPFAAEGLRAKPYSPRQQLQRAVQAQVQALSAWWNG